MTTVRSAPPAVPPTEAEGGAPGDRLRRLRQRQRLMREELLAVVFLLLALAATLAVLALQWLSGPPSSPGAIHLPSPSQEVPYV